MSGVPDLPAPVPAPDPVPDRGEVPSAVAAALRAYAADRGSLADVLLALQDSRLLVPMVEVPEGTFPDHDHDDEDHEHDHHEHGHRGGAQLAAVSLERPDGRRGLLAFTGTEPLSRWNPTARPLPLSTRQAAETAVRDGATALVVDVAGPVQVVIQGDDLDALAQGWTLGRVGDRSGWVGPGASAWIGGAPE